MQSRPSAVVLLLAAVFTALNCLKPLHGDDGVYCIYAAHIAQHPCDPYGFEFGAGCPANQTLAPPVLLYWLAAGIRLLGDHPALWKLWMFPFGVLFTASLYRLFGYFAPGLERPLTCLTVLSPAFLPAWNLMLDIPALALGLAALVTFLGACKRQSWQRAVAAGLITGLAMQTKYTATVIPAVLFAYAVLARRPRLGVLAGLAAVGVAASWECFIAMRYGQSHFLLQFSKRNSGFVHRLGHLILPLIAMLGAVGPALALFGLAALGRSRRAVVGVGLMAILGYLLVACVPADYAVFWRDADTGKERLTLNNLVFGGLGLLVCCTAGAVVCRLWRTTRCSAGAPWTWAIEPNAPAARAATQFLIFWLVLEIAMCLLISPFPAVRRLMGVLVVGTLLVGRLAAPACREPGRLGLMRGVVVFGAALGMLYYVVDLRDAFAGKIAVQRAVRWIHKQEPQATVCFYGWPGYQVYADRSGMIPVVGNGPAVHAGAWYIEDSRLPTRCPGDVAGLRARVLPVREFAVSDSLPLRTTLCYYCGTTAMEHVQGARYSLILSRVR